MKMNKKIVVSSLAICMGAGLVGSVSGTVAWYQYSTKSAVNMMGASVGVSKMLQIGIGGNGVATDNLAENPTKTVYKGGLTMADVESYLKNTVVASGNAYGDGTKFSPVTSKTALTKDDAVDPEDFVGNPIAGVANMSEWIAAEKTDYVILPLWIRAVETDKDGEHYVARKVGMSDVKIANKSVSGKKDISNAVRVNINSVNDDENDEDDVNLLLANVAETVTSGELDLDGIAGPDTVAGKYEWEDGHDETIKYNGTGVKQTSYNLTDETTYSSIMVDDKYSSTNLDAFKGGKQIGTTNEDGTGILVNVVIWLEGWQTLTYKAANDGAVWSAKDYIGAEFYLGITFCCNLGVSE